MRTAVVIFLWILITLTTRAQAMGRQYAWSEPIFELPWFGQYPGMPANMYGQGAGMPGMPWQGGYAYPGYPSPGPYTPGPMPQMAPQMVNGGYVVSQQPGHSVVIQPNSRGQHPTITQVPGMVTSA